MNPLDLGLSIPRLGFVYVELCCYSRFRTSSERGNQAVVPVSSQDFAGLCQTLLPSAIALSP